MPQIIDYVHLKKELDLIRHEVVSWERKVEIAATNEKITRKKFFNVTNDMTGTGGGGYNTKRRPQTQ